MPGSIATRLKETPGTIADGYSEVTVLFADIVDFTTMSAAADPVDVVSKLNEIFSEFDDLAAKHGIHLEGLGGTEGGVIGALASVGLSASGNDGRYVLVGSIRTLSGLQPLGAVLASGIASVRTLDGQPVSDGLVLADNLRPARREGQPILFVEREDDHWLPLKLD